jgi:hypothetical protein
MEVKNFVKLRAAALPIDEVVIRSLSAEELILSALNKVKDNYSINPEMQTSFYRETIKQRKNMFRYLKL